ncbi:MAG: LemA family protein [Planctomycetes bacterium]|nr:LemA family protein [Planctomycetota bacterium]
MNRRSGGIGILKILIGLVVVFGIFACVIGGCAKSGYDKAVGLDETVKSKWAQVENQLQRRFDLIPNLVNTVKGYAGHEKEIFENIANARTKYFQASKGGSVGQKVAAANGLQGAMSRLLFLQEKYPDLKAAQQFTTLMAQLEGTENRIAVERMRFNNSVKDLNFYRRSLFGKIYCAWADVTAAEYFEVTDKAAEAPKVDFGGGG